MDKAFLLAADIHTILLFASTAAEQESRKQELKRQQQQQQQQQMLSQQQQPRSPKNNNNHHNNNCPVYNMRNLPAIAELVHSKNKKDYLMTLLALLLASAKRAEGRRGGRNKKQLHFSYIAKYALECGACFPNLWRI